MNKSSTKILLTTFFVLISALSQNISTIGLPVSSSPTNSAIQNQIKTMLSLSALTNQQIKNINKYSSSIEELLNEIKDIGNSKTADDISKIASKQKKIKSYVGR